MRRRTGVECITKVIRKAKSRWFGRLVRRDHEEHIKTFWRQEKKNRGGDRYSNEEMDYRRSRRV